VAEAVAALTQPMAGLPSKSRLSRQLDGTDCSQKVVCPTPVYNWPAIIVSIREVSGSETFPRHGCGHGEQFVWGNARVQAERSFPDSRPMTHSTWVKEPLDQA
jgi:hypothetical protein